METAKEKKSKKQPPLNKKKAGGKKIVHSQAEMDPDAGPRKRSGRKTN